MNLDVLLESSIPLIFALQSLGDGLIAIMKLFTFFGDETFYLIMFPVIFWCIDNRLGFRAGLILLLSSTFNSYFKWAFRLPRPYWISNEVTAHTVETSFGAPSGHSQNTVAMWGLIAASIRKPWAWAGAIFLMLMVGLSRMVMGVHFLLDVLTGWAIGMILLWLFLRLEPGVANYFTGKSASIKVAASFLASITLICIAAAILSAISSWEIPNLWMHNAQLAAPDAEPIHPLAISGVVSNAAALFGISAGYVIMNQLGGFSTQGKLTQQIFKFVIGMIGLLVIWMGLDFIFPEGQTLVAYIFRYIRYGLAGGWIALGAPWIFVKTKLTEPAQ